MQNWSVYLVQTADGKLYCGVSTDVKRRFAEHCSGNARAAKALRGCGPLQLVYHYQAQSKRSAMQLEYRLKRLSKSRKQALVEGHWQLSELEQQLLESQ